MVAEKASIATRIDTAISLDMKRNGMKRRMNGTVTIRLPPGTQRTTAGTMNGQRPGKSLMAGAAVHALTRPLLAKAKLALATSSRILSSRAAVKKKLLRQSRRSMKKALPIGEVLVKARKAARKAKAKAIGLLLQVLHTIRPKARDIARVHHHWTKGSENLPR